jgi:hypothetical protein
MPKNQIKYELIGFYENYNNSGRIKLKLTNSDSLICCYIDDIKFISKYLSELDNRYISQLVQSRR